jgi:hypothetical protein
MTDPRGSECHCILCGQTFTGLGLFDAHQDVNYTRQPVIICRDPTALGLAQDARGTWGTPAGLAARDFHARRLARANSDRRQAFADAEADSWDEPGVTVEEMIKAAHDRRAQGQAGVDGNTAASA